MQLPFPVSDGDDFSTPEFKSQKGWLDSFREELLLLALIVLCQRSAHRQERLVLWAGYGQKGEQVC